MSILGLLIGAAILGGIIAVMEQGDFPGFLPMIACILAANVPAAIVNLFLPPTLFIVGLGVGTVCAGFVISALCGMSFKRSMIAVGIYFAIMIVVGIILAAITV